MQLATKKVELHSKNYGRYLLIKKVKIQFQFSTNAIYIVLLVVFLTIPTIKDRRGKSR